MGLNVYGLAKLKDFFPLSKHLLSIIVYQEGVSVSSLKQGDILVFVIAVSPAFS